MRMGGIALGPSGLRRIATGSIALTLALWWASGVAQAAPLPLGALTQLSGPLGCFSIDGSSEDGAGTCAVGRAIDGAESVTVSPDGKNVYVGSYRSTNESGLSVFARDPSNQLTQLVGTAGCLTKDGASQAGPGTCAKVRGFGTGDGRDLAFSADGRWAYLANQHNNPADPAASIVILQRDPATGVLTQPAGTAGCISVDGSSQDGAGTCQTDAKLAVPMGVSLSPDGNFVYVADYGGSNLVHVFARNPTTGALTDIQCIAEATAPTGCTTGRVLGDSQSVVITPDGKHAYSADYSNGISIFDRDPMTGLLTQKAGGAGCITNTGKDDTAQATCTAGRVLGGAYAISISPDGQTLYVPAASNNGVAIFHINGDGSLTQLAGTAGCITINGNDQNGVAAKCGVAKPFQRPYGATISPDGRNLYVTSDNTPGGVTVFSLDPSSGVATQLTGLNGCITSDGSANGTAGLCVDGRALNGSYEIAISPDGGSAYVASYDPQGQAVSLFARETAPVCSALSASTAFGTAISIKLACVDADGQPLSFSIVAGPTHGTLGAVSQAAGTVTYTPASGFVGSDSFTFSASDGNYASGPATASVSVGPPPPAPATPAKFMLIGLPNGSGGNVSFSLACQAAAGTVCRGLAQLTTLERLLGKRIVGLLAARPKRHSTRVTAGTLSFSLGAGQSKRLVVPLNATGRRLLARFGRLPATLTLKLLNTSPPTVLQAKTTIKPKKKKKHK